MIVWKVSLEQKLRIKCKEKRKLPILCHARLSVQIACKIKSLVASVVDQRTRGRVGFMHDIRKLLMLRAFFFFM